MNAWRLLLSCLVASCLLMTGTTTATAARAAADDDEAYTVVIKKVSVKKTKADGSSWDINDGKPDLAVKVRNASDSKAKAYTTKTKDDVFEAEFNEPTNIKFRKGQTLEFEVLDIDVAVNDLIGKTSKEMTEAMLKKGKLTFENFGQVIRLEVEVKKVTSK